MENELNKLNISIWGCCASRNIFNYHYVKDLFNVDSYIFQIAPQTVFAESLAFPEEEIDKIDAPNFIKRMLKDDFNKSALDDFTNRSGGGIA